jgi:DNA-nicking Smr family endonuclease
VSKKDKISPDDLKLFREAVADAVPLAHGRVMPHRDPPPPRPLKREQDEQQVLDDMLSGDINPAELETGEELLFSRPGLQHSVLKKLRRGQYAIEAELDLHGLRVDEARQALTTFLHAALERGVKTVRIIHGKGHGSLHKQPILKGKVNHWLRQRSEILAFCSARPVDGGTGAIYVLLQRSLRNRREHR